MLKLLKKTLPVLKKATPLWLKPAVWQLVLPFMPDEAAKRFCDHNSKTWPLATADTGNKVVLFDAFPFAETVLTISYFLNILAKKNGAAFRPFSAKGIGNPWTRKIYSSFGAGPEVLTRLSGKRKSESAELADKIFSQLKSKKDVFNIEILGYSVGIDIYESYLRFCAKPTVEIDEGLKKVIQEAVELTFFWDDFFKQNTVCAFVLSHSCYIHLNIPAKIAYQKKVPVYIANARRFFKMTKPFQLYGYVPHMRQMFKSLSKEEQAAGIDLAKRQIERRLSGEVGVDMPYSTKTGYTPVSAKRVLKESDRIKVLIASHCFYDNPYAVGDLLFLDFFEWISFLGKLSEQTNYDWYLKMHPDPLPGTEEIMAGLLKKYPRIHMLPKDTSHLQLVKEGLDYVLTCYGSVGQEYPALGVQVINAGFNPREAYDFNWHPKSVSEYKDLLLRLDELDLKFDINDLYEFYYMYYYYVHVDDLVFVDYIQAEKDLGGYGGMQHSAAYGYFLNQLTPEKHAAIIAKMSEFIDSGADYYFLNGPQKLYADHENIRSVAYPPPVDADSVQ